MLKKQNFIINFYKFSLNFNKNILTNFFLNNLFSINNLILNNFVQTNIFLNFLILKKYFFFKFFDFKKTKKYYKNEDVINTELKFLKKMKSKKLIIEKSKIINWSTSFFLKKYYKNHNKFAYLKNFKYWKYNFLQKNFLIKSNNFLKFLKKKILISQIFFYSFFFKIKKNKQMNIFFSLFKNFKNNFIYFDFFFKKFYYSLFFAKFFKKFKRFFILVKIFLNKNKFLMFTPIYKINFFYSKKWKFKPFIFRKKPSLKYAIKVFKRKYWVKKTKRPYYKNNNKIHLYKNIFNLHRNILINFYKIDCKKNNYNYYINYIFNLWNIRSYNWKQIT